MANEHWVGRNDDHAKEQREEKREGAQRVSLILSRTKGGSESGARGGLCVSFVGVPHLVYFLSDEKKIFWAFESERAHIQKNAFRWYRISVLSFFRAKGNKRLFLRVWARTPYSLQMRRNWRNKRQKTGSGLLSPRYQPLCNFVPFATPNDFWLGLLGGKGGKGGKVKGANAH